MILNEAQVLELIKIHSKEKADWVTNARVNNKMLKALVTGEGFSEELIERIEHIESDNKAKARKKYSKDIRDMFNRVMKKRENVFQANGGSESILIRNQRIIEEFTFFQSNFKANKSVSKYLAENFFHLMDIDPNGVIFLEYKSIENNLFDLYPSYKSIQKIKYYEPKGQLMDFIIFEPEVKESGVQIWRIVDDLTDWTISEVQGLFFINKEKTFVHPFGQVPGIILSDKEKIGTNERLSYLNPVIELAKDYARDKSVLTIYKFLNGFPINWRFVSQCKTCTGTGKQNNQNCNSCDGKGYISKGDVTDLVTLPLPKEGQPNIAPDIAGFVSPDLKTWQQYKEDLKDMENLVDDTLWGTEKGVQVDRNNETATGRFIDIQPITNALNLFSDNVEWVENKIVNWIINFVDPIKQKDEILFSKSYGRRYIIESPDIILEKYQKAKQQGDNNTILDKLLEEFILSKHKSDPAMQSVMIKKKNIEPYVHLSIMNVNTLYGSKESYKKVSFQNFWEQCDKTKDEKILKEEFEAFHKIEAQSLELEAKKPEEKV